MSSVEFQQQGPEYSSTAGTGMSGAHARMHELLFGASIVQMIRCAALYKFADHLATGPQTPEAIATAENLNADATQRLMRACAAFGLMTSEPDGHFASTPLLETLREDDPGQLRYLAITQGGSGHWRPWGMLDQAVETGFPQADTSLGTSFWEYLASTGGAQEANAFAKLFGGVFAAVDEVAAQQLDTLGVETAADIGGAEGSLLRALMRANSSMKGVLLDLPHVADSAAELAENIALGERLTISGGSFFERVPMADLYLLRTVLHDFPDEECLEILRQCRQSARPGARLAIIELVMQDGPGAAFTAQIDLTMMTVLGGRERTQAQYRSLVEQAGFEMRSITTLVAPFSMIEAVAV